MGIKSLSRDNQQPQTKRPMNTLNNGVSVHWLKNTHTSEVNKDGYREILDAAERMKEDK